MKKMMVLAALAMTGSLTAQVNLKGKVVDATQGYTYQGGAPNNQPLCGNGTVFAPSVSCGTAANPFYQTIAVGGVNQPARFILDFSSDNFRALTPTGSTELDLSLKGTPGTYSNPSSITTDAYGRVTGVASGPAYTGVTCNANGCYDISPTGKITAWGTVVGSFPSSSVLNVTINFPVTFTSNPSLVVSAAGQPGGNDDSLTVYHKGRSTVGATVVARCSVNIGGGGCAGGISGFLPIDWQAVGN